MTPVMPDGIASKDDERINERRELRHQDQVDQYDRQHQADAEALERLPH